MNKQQVLDRIAASEGRAAFFGQNVDAGDFKNMVFEHSVDFYGATFTGDVDFSSTTFKQPARFRAVQFKGRAAFDFCRFEVAAEFSESTFDGEASFARSEVGGTARFWRTRFGDRATFREMVVNAVGRSRHSGDWQEQANFSWARFEKEAVLTFARFHVPCHFWRPLFRGNALMDECIFGSSVSFGGRQTDVLMPRFTVIAPETAGILEARGLFTPDTEVHVTYQNRWVSAYLMFSSVYSAEHLAERLRQVGEDVLTPDDQRKIIEYWKGEALPTFARDSVVSFRRATFNELSDESFSHIDLSGVGLDGSVAGGDAGREAFRRALESRSYDVFICHSSDDKDSLARPLAEKLRECGLVVWYDETRIAPGSSLRETIERGLERSRYGVVVLTPTFLAKTWQSDGSASWTREEVEALLCKSPGKILPVWYGVDADDVRRRSPALADLRAENANAQELEATALKLAKRIHSQG
ncbi:MAG: TIR domain-containing protein [Polyangiaceae bacterium]|nr:TIR domain-containing protein [Polyangiaceae bacterium]